MPDYSKGKIYMIRTEKGCYIGSTTVALLARLSRHLSKMKQALRGEANYCSSFEAMYGAKEKIEIVLLEDFPCKSKKELEAREAEVIKETECMNNRSTGEYWKDKTPLQQMIHDLSTEYRAGRAEHARRRREDPEYRAERNKRQREADRRRREDPEYHAEYKKRDREAKRRLRADPEYREECNRRQREARRKAKEVA